MSNLFNEYGYITDEARQLYKDRFGKIVLTDPSFEQNVTVVYKEVLSKLTHDDLINLCARMHAEVIARMGQS